jgi:hypothetical protein
MLPSSNLAIGIVWKGNGLTPCDAIQIVAVLQYWYTRLYQANMISCSFEQFLFDAMTKKKVGPVIVEWIDAANIFTYSILPCIMILNGFWYSFPISKKIIPICVSMSWILDTVNETNANELKKLGPIGCREHHTECLLQLANVPCFFSGCITSIVEQGKYKYLSLFKSTTTEIADNNTVYTNFAEPIALAYEQLYLMAQTPTPIRTSNLNVFVAARAFGIPATLVGEPTPYHLMLVNKAMIEPHKLKEDLNATLQKLI